MIRESIWGVKRKEKVEIETRWLPLTLRHSCSLIPAPSPDWQPAWGEERKNRKQEHLKDNNRVCATTVVHKINRKLSICVLQNDSKRPSGSRSGDTCWIPGLCFMFTDSEIERVEPRSQANGPLDPGGGGTLLTLKFCPLKSLNHSKTTPTPLAQLDHGTCTFMHVQNERWPGGEHTQTHHTCTHAEKKWFLREHFCIAWQVSTNEMLEGASTHQCLKSRKEEKHNV